VVGGVVLLDEDGVLDERLEGEDAPLDEGLLVLGVLVLGVLRQLAVLLRVVDPSGDLGTSLVDELVQLGAQLRQAFA
jgi:hypothetical protein